MRYAECENCGKTITDGETVCINCLIEAEDKQVTAVADGRGGWVWSDSHGPANPKEER